MKTNEAYCPLLFNEIYNDSSGEYRFCCHASTIERKFTMHTHTPFEYFNSEFMEEKRNSIMRGKTYTDTVLQTAIQNVNNDKNR